MGIARAFLGLVLLLQAQGPGPQELAARAVLFCHVTTRLRGDPYPNLMSEKGGRGFPHIVILDAEGNLLARHAAQRTPAELGNTVDRGRRLLDLRSKGEAGDRGARLEFLEAALPEGILGDEEIERRRKELGALAPGEAARLDVAAARRREYLIRTHPSPAERLKRLEEALGESFFKR